MADFIQVIECTKILYLSLVESKNNSRYNLHKYQPNGDNFINSIY